jgi:hypothetical protein
LTKGRIKVALDVSVNIRVYGIDPEDRGHAVKHPFDAMISEKSGQAKPAALNNNLYPSRMFGDFLLGWMIDNF